MKIGRKTIKDFAVEAMSAMEMNFIKGGGTPFIPEDHMAPPKK